MGKYRIYYVDKYHDTKTIVFEGTLWEATKFSETLGKVEKIEDLNPPEPTPEYKAYNYPGYFSTDDAG